MEKPDEDTDEAEIMESELSWLDREHDEIVVYRTRWLMLALFSISSATSSILWITFAPVASLVEDFYDISSAQVNALSILYMAAYLPMTVVSSYVFHRCGVRYGLIMACTFNCLSGLVRFLSTESNEEPRGSNAYTILIFGQTIGALAQPFFLNLPAKIGSVWFAKDERDLAVVIGSIADLIGVVIGSIIPAFFTEDDGESIKMFDLLLTEFLLTAIVLILVALLFREKPPTPPSISESHRAGSEKDVIQELKVLFTSKDFDILVVCFGVLAAGIFNCLTTVMEQLIEPAGYTTDDASLFTGLLVGCGIVSAIGVGFALDRTHKYNLFLKVGFVISGILLIGLTLALRPDNGGDLAAIFALLGASMIPLLPIAFQCACECTYPINEHLSSGALMSAGQVSGIVFILIVATLLDQQPQYTSYIFEPTYIVFTVASVLFMVGIQFYDGKYLRLEAERDADLS